MKVAIITQAYDTKCGTNYGNRLQNFALQEILASLDIMPETIAQKRIAKTSAYITICHIVMNILRNLFIKNYRRRQMSFKRFNSKYIIWGKKQFTYNVVPDGLNEDYDYFIIGSDQVWNTQPKDMRDRRNIYLCTFAEPKKRIAFAASFGISYISDECINDFKKELPEFKAISVREQEGVELVKQCGAKAVMVLDPTMMLMREKWDRLAKKPKFISNEHYVVTYFIGGPDETILRYVESIAKGRKIININDITNTETYSAPPEEFVWLIGHSDCVLTDSFHGSAFSILYHKPFLVFDRLVNGKDIKMGSRIDTLLNTFHLQLCRNNIHAPGGMPMECDWEQVDEILKEERMKSMEFLRHALEI